MASRATRLFFIDILKPFKWLIVGQIVVAIIVAINMSVQPYVLKVILDRLSCLTPPLVGARLMGPISLYVFVTFFVILTYRFYDYLWLQVNPFLKRHIGDILVGKMMRQSQALFHEHFAGALANKIKDVMSGVPDLLKLVINEFFSNFLALAIAIFTVSTTNYTFSYLLFGWSVIFCVGTFLFTFKAKSLSFASAQARTTVMGRIVDIFTNIMSVNLFSAGEVESVRLRVYLDEYVRADQARDWWFLYMFAFQGATFVIYQAVTFVVLVAGFKNGTLTSGDFALIVVLNSSIIKNLWSLSKDISKLSVLIGDITQGLNIALLPVEIQDKPDAVPLHVTEGNIIFDHVEFHYKQADLLFHDKSVIIKPGQKVGLVGYSGSGKTTFVNLILRLYDITKGRITIDGQDIRDVTQDSLHAHIGMIPQNPVLFHRSVKENIRYGRPDATDSEIIEAAKRAHAHEFIVNMDGGYDATVGEGGAKLSGGQRQRIVIARAILKNAPILILDEATSQLDSITEGQIQESLWQLMEEAPLQKYDVLSDTNDSNEAEHQYLSKTVLVVAHRLSTLLRMDRILVFNNGIIVQDGTHEQLLAQKGVYNTLWEAQVGGFIIDQKGDQEAV